MYRTCDFFDSLNVLLYSGGAVVYGSLKGTFRKVGQKRVPLLCFESRTLLCSL